MSKVTKEEVLSSMNFLTRILEVGDTIFTKLNHRSQSGMTRYYDVYVARPNDIIRITWATSLVTGYSYRDSNDSLVIKGCGFSGPHEIAFTLGLALFKDGNAFSYREI